MKDIVFISAIILIAGVLGISIGGNEASKAYERKAIEMGVGRYNPTNGNFQFYKEK